MSTARPPADDAAALERYRYLLRTAHPDELEATHAEAFSKLSAAQREQVLAAIAAEDPDGHRPDACDTQALARYATRAEMRRPGTLERVLGSRNGRYGGFGGGLLAGVATAFVGSALLDGLLDTGFGDGGLIDLGGGPGFDDFGGVF